MTAREGRPSPSQQLRALRTRYSLTFKSRLSQHFLVDARMLESIAAAACGGDGEVVLEVGAGAGFLTARLLDAGARVLAVEIDPGMIDLLRLEFGNEPRLTVVQADILACDLPRLLDSAGAQHCVVVGNLPYHITSPALFHLLGAGPRAGENGPVWRRRVRRLVLTVQEEVGARMVSPPGSRTYGSLSVAMAYLGRIERLATLPPGMFTPRPKVDSMLLALEPVEPRLDLETEALFFRLIRAAFSQRRKVVANALARTAGGKAQAILLLERAGLDPGVRAERFGLADYLMLARTAASDNSLLNTRERSPGKSCP